MDKIPISFYLKCFDKKSLGLSTLIKKGKQMKNFKKMALILCFGLMASLVSFSADARDQLANGVACTFNSDCASGNCSFNVCKSKTSSKKNLGNGIACTFNSDCASGNCSFNVCKSKNSSKKNLGNGIACTFNSDCASGNCSFNVCKAR